MSELGGLKSCPILFKKPLENKKMAKTKKVTVSLIVDAPVEMKPERVAELIGMLVDGWQLMTDAEYVDCYDLDAIQDAKDARSLGFEEPTAIA